jgi:LDH2 family malate/lactate/ureidoglycolate dehydrogenase
MQEPSGDRLSLSVLHQFCQDVLQAAGVPAESAAIVADSLTRADACGLYSHGSVRLLPVYTRRLLAGTTRALPEIQVVRRRKSVAVLDGGAGLGQVVGSRAMELAVEMARDTGTGTVAVRNSSHFGTSAFFLQHAVAADMIGIVMTNAPSNMPPWGGRAPFFGTNPLAVGLPCGEEPPVILDMSTSVVARGKIVIAAQMGQSIPTGWAIDKDGNPTQDAEAALTGAVLPVGGYKGSGLAVIIDALCGVLSGAAFGPHIINLYDEGDQVQNLGHFFMAMDVDAFMDVEMFKQRMDQFLREIREQPRMVGVDHIYTPGEIEFAETQKSIENGVALPNITELDQLADRLNVKRLSERKNE